MSFFDDQDNAERLRVMEQRAAQKDAAKVSIDNLAARYPDESQDIPQPSPSPLTRGQVEEGGPSVDWQATCYQLRLTLAQQAQEIERFKAMSTVEMMCENANVDAHVREWEARCLKAEATLAAMTAERDAACGELLVSIDDAPIGSLAGKLVMANRVLRSNLVASQQKERELESKETALKKHIETSKATLAAREAEIVKIKAELNETWIDERETVWTRPTAWAYAMVCKARDNKEAERDAAVREAGRLRARLAEMEGEA